MSFIENPDETGFFMHVSVSTFPRGEGPVVDRFIQCDVEECGDLWGIHGNEAAITSNLTTAGWRFLEDGKHHCPEHTQD